MHVASGIQGRGIARDIAVPCLVGRGLPSDGCERYAQFGGPRILTLAHSRGPGLHGQRLDHARFDVLVQAPARALGIDGELPEDRRFRGKDKDLDGILLPQVGTIVPGPPNPGHVLFIALDGHMQSRFIVRDLETGLLRCQVIGAGQLMESGRPRHGLPLGADRSVRPNRVRQAEQVAACRAGGQCRGRARDRCLNPRCCRHCGPGLRGRCWAVAPDIDRCRGLDACGRVTHSQGPRTDGLIESQRPGTTVTAASRLQVDRQAWTLVPVRPCRREA